MFSLLVNNLIFGQVSLSQNENSLIIENEIVKHQIEIIPSLSALALTDFLLKGNVPVSMASTSLVMLSCSLIQLVKNEQF